jgi:hypothetical protein
MSSMDRRKFLGVVGAGTAAVSAATISTAALFTANTATPRPARGPGTPSGYPSNSDPGPAHSACPLVPQLSAWWTLMIGMTVSTA